MKESYKHVTVSNGATMQLSGANGGFPPVAPSTCVLALAAAAATEVY